MAMRDRAAPTLMAQADDRGPYNRYTRLET